MSEDGCGDDWDKGKTMSYIENPKVRDFLYNVWAIAVGVFFIVGLLMICWDYAIRQAELRQIIREHHQKVNP